MANIYEFSPEDAERFAAHVGIKARQRGHELSFTWCPYCQGNGKDRNTFSISLDTGQFKCLRASCSVQGNMITLSRDFGLSLGRDADTYYGLKWQRFNVFTKAPETIEIRDAAVKYLKSRGISETTTRRYYITTQKDRENVLIFPFSMRKTGFSLSNTGIRHFRRARTEQRSGAKRTAGRSCSGWRSVIPRTKP